MKLIDNLDKLNGKTIAFSAESWEDDIIAFGTTENELVFLKSYFDGSMESRLKILDFSDAKDVLKEEENLRYSIEKANPSILGDLSDEIKDAEEREKEEAEFKKYKELDKKFRKRLISEGHIF